MPQLDILTWEYEITAILVFVIAGYWQISTSLLPQIFVNLQIKAYSKVLSRRNEKNLFNKLNIIFSYSLINIKSINLVKSLLKALTGTLINIFEKFVLEWSLALSSSLFFLIKLQGVNFFFLLLDSVLIRSLFFNNVLKVKINAMSLISSNIL